MSKTSDKLVIPKVNNDLSWIKQYTSIYNLFNQDQWEKNQSRSFDSLGVHLTKKGYHPVNACHYALFCYDEYLATKNERFKKAFLAQVTYLRDCTKYDEFEGERVGYPYLITFHDLKPPWYSSLAQGEAISVLIRYYALTRDETVLPLIVKIKNFMVYPMNKGGCLDISPEGYEWYEEYTNSKQEAHNFSGYYIAVIAMGEYSQLFPEDTASSNIYKRTLLGGKMSNKVYDSGSGIYYNRGDKRLCAPSYLKWMTNLMQHMTEFTGDDFFNCQKMIWSTYSSGKDYVDVGVKKDYYNWSIPLTKTVDNKFNYSAAKEKQVTSSMVKELNDGSRTLTHASVFDGNIKTVIKLNRTDNGNEDPFVSILFTKEIETDNLELSLQLDSATHKFRKINLYYLSDAMNDWKLVSNVKLIESANKLYNLNFKKIKFNQFKISFDDKSKNPIVVSDIKIKETIKFIEPEFLFYRTEAYEIKNGKAEINCDFDPGIKHWIFYRTAKTAKELAKKPFPAENSLSKNTVKINTADKFVEYLIMCEYTNTGNGIKNLKIE